MPTPTSNRLGELTWEELEDGAPSTVLLPVGSTEQHGRHLPLSVDTLMPEQIAERVCDRTDALVAPSIPYGVSPHHTFKPGTVSVESETFQHYVRDVCASFGEWGVDAVVLLNGHYLAQDPELDVVVRTLRNEHDIEAFHVPLLDLFDDEAADGRESDLAFHAAEFETSIVLALAPELVRLGRAETVQLDADGPRPLTSYDALGENRVSWALSAADMDELTPAGNVGDPSVATAGLGERLVETAVDRLTQLVAALDEEEPSLS